MESNSVTLLLTKYRQEFDEAHIITLKNIVITLMPKNQIFIKQISCFIEHLISLKRHCASHYYNPNV